MMKNALVRLQEYRIQANGAEKDLVRYLLEKPEGASKLNIHVLAEKTCTPAATITRLCKRLRSSGCKKFNNSLSCGLALHSKVRKDISTETSQGGGLKGIVDKVTYRSIQTSENTRKLVDLDELQNCVDIIEKARTAGLLGIGPSLLTARDVYPRFPRLNKPCIRNDDRYSQLVCAGNLTKEDVAVIFSCSGLTREMSTYARVLGEQNIPIITVTRFVEDDPTHLADYKLYVPAKELLVRTVATTSRVSQLNIIDILFIAYVRNNYEENIARLKNSVTIKDII